MRSGRPAARTRTDLESLRPASTGLLRNDYPFGLRRSSLSNRSDQGSSLLVIPRFEISSNLSWFELLSQSGRRGPLGSPVFAKLIQ
jgi:hypothetical protein